HSKETWRQRRRSLWHHQQRRTGNGDAAEWCDAARRWNDGRGDLASGYLHPKRGKESGCGEDGKCSARKRIVFWFGGVRNVPHGWWKGREVGAGFNRLGRGAFDRIFDGVSAESKQETGAGDFGGDEGIFARVRDGECDDPGWDEISGRRVERG